MQVVLFYCHVAVMSDIVIVSTAPLEVLCIIFYDFNTLDGRQISVACLFSRIADALGMDVG